MQTRTKTTLLVLIIETVETTAEEARPKSVRPGPAKCLQAPAKLLAGGTR